MPRGSQPNSKHQLIKALVIGDGKCGKTDWAARAVEGGFNVLYMDGDVGTQTIMGLPHDKTKPVSAKLMDNIFIMNMADTLLDGGLDYRFVKSFKKFASQPTFRWNDSRAREFALSDGDPTEDAVWEIRPGHMDHNTVWVIDSWTSLTQSAMNWACDELGLDMEQISEEERRQMRSVYQAAGEKLTYYLMMIRSAPCHVIVIGHPREFTKTEKSPGKSVTQKESDMKVLWTKMVPASSSNNHAFGMAKFFTDIAWMESKVDGTHMIDFRSSADRLSGSHIPERLDSRAEGSFCNVLKRLGGVLPGAAQPFDHWLSIHETGFSLGTAGKKPSLILGAKNNTPPDGSPQSTPAKVAIKPVGGLNLNMTKQG